MASRFANLVERAECVKGPRVVSYRVVSCREEGGKGKGTKERRERERAWGCMHPFVLACRHIPSPFHPSPSLPIPSHPRRPQPPTFCVVHPSILPSFLPPSSPASACDPTHAHSAQTREAGRKGRKDRTSRRGKKGTRKLPRPVRASRCVCRTAFCIPHPVVSHPPPTCKLRHKRKKQRKERVKSATPHLASCISRSAVHRSLFRRPGR